MVGQSRPGVHVSGSSLSLYHTLAKHYDALYSWKDYRAESRRLVSLARQYGRSGGRTWLDVACGTGRHLEFLRARYSVSGVDASREMLRAARRRLPGVRLVRGDMRSFRVRGRFDVVSCLFSAIGHLRTESDLRATFENLARHTKPGGVVIVEPWLEPSRFKPGHVHLTTFESPRLTLVRLSRGLRSADRSLIQYEYLVAEPGRRIRHFSEVDTGLMVPHRRLVELLRGAGLRSRYLRRGFMRDRGLLMAVKPLSVPVDTRRPPAGPARPS